MENILITTQRNSDADFLLNLVRKLGFDALIISDDKKRLLARKKLIQLSDAIEKSDVSDAEIQEEISRIRAKRNEKKN